MRVYFVERVFPGIYRNKHCVGVVCIATKSVLWNLKGIELLVDSSGVGLSCCQDTRAGNGQDDNGAPFELSTWRLSAHFNR